MQNTFLWDCFNFLKRKEQIGFILIQFWIFTPLISQSNWFMPGAKWSYDFSAFTGHGLITLEVTIEDTLIGNRIFKRLLSTTLLVQSNNELDTVREYLFVREENNYVYSYDGMN